MLPTSPALDVADSGDGHSVLSGNFHLGSSVVSYCERLRLCKSAASVALSSVLPTLSNLVDHVAELVARNQVFRVHTERIVTFVQDVFAGAKLTLVQFKRNAMGARLNNTSASHGETPVASA